MNPVAAAIVGGTVAYIAGAMPFGKWIAGSRGIDILNEGSGNIGATNVWRTLGPRFGFLVLFLDAAKGFCPSYFLPLFAGFPLGDPNLGIGFGAAAVLGHSFSPFLHFKGGKSVATALGVMAAITPEVAGIAFGVFLLLLAVTGYVSVGSMVGAISAPILAYAFGYPSAVVVAYSILAALIVFRHHANISRLRSGTEPKFRTKKGDGD
jgi:glycerol-3-phosphate acyltransferase PlsY